MYIGMRNNWDHDLSILLEPHVGPFLGPVPLQRSTLDYQSAQSTTKAWQLQLVSDTAPVPEWRMAPLPEGRSPPFPLEVDVLLMISTHHAPIWAQPVAYRDLGYECRKWYTWTGRL